MPLNPYWGMQNVFGNGLGSSGNFDYDTPGGFDDNPMRSAFSGLDQTPDDYGFNQRLARRAMTPAFSNYNVESPAEINRRQNSLRQYEEGPATKAYIDYANQGAPNREDYKPSKWATALATLAGGATGYRNPAAGIKTAMDIRSHGYDTAASDYQDKLKAMHDAASIESQNENYAALSGYRNFGAETGALRQGETARSNQVKEGQSGAWNLARIDQFGKTNAQKTAELSEKQREFGITSTERERNNRATNKIGETNAGANVTRAGAAVTGAAAAATNADTNAKREKDYGRDVDSKISDRINNPKGGSKNKGPSPAEIDKATKAAAAQLRANNSEEYGDFADKYGNATPPTGFFGGATTNPKFKKFNDDVKALSEQMLKQKYPGYTHTRPIAPPAAAPANPDAVDGSVDY